MDSDLKSLELKEMTPTKRFSSLTFEPIIEEEKESNVLKVE